LIQRSILASDFNGITIADKLIEQTGVIGEKLNQFFETGRCFCRSYIHSGNKIATLVALSKNIEGAEEV
jgi:elongation factor Ts